MRYLEKHFPFSVCLVRCLKTSNIYISVGACLSLFHCCQIPFPWLSFFLQVLTCSAHLYTLLSFGNSQHFLESSGMLIFSTQSTECGGRRRRQCSFTQFYYFLPSVSILKAEDYFQMCPVANPIITWILGPTTQHCGLGISVPHETMCGLSFDIEKKITTL